MPIPKNKNDDFFGLWSRDMAYVLGFFAADGSMTKNNRGAHYIEFHIADKDIIEKIRDALGSNHKIKKRRRNDSWKDAYRLQIGSKKMYQDLEGLGMTEAKSKTLRMPDVPDKYLCHFVRGYFDGDGNVYANEYTRRDRGKKHRTLLAGFTCGSRGFLEELHGRLKGFSVISGGSLYDRQGYSRLYYSVHDSCKLYKFMYNTSSKLYLNRKKRVFEDFMRERQMTL